MTPGGDRGRPTTDEYVVAIKPSARRINVRAARWVAARGPERAFASKAAAKAWAEAIGEGPASVRVQNAAPNDPAPVTGYLVADPARDRRPRDDAESSPVTLDDYER